MSNNTTKKEAATINLIENVLMGNKDAAKEELQKLVSMRIGEQIQKVGKENLI